jgi:Ca2+-binding RTX toxin-like protein
MKYNAILEFLFILIIALSFFQISQFVFGAIRSLTCLGAALCSEIVEDNVIIGDNAPNVMTGLDGSSVMLGLNEDDYMSGSNRSDQMIGGKGDDTLSGGDGSDEIMGSTGNDTIFGDDGADEIMGGEGKDTIYGGNGPDTIMGGAGDDVIVGGLGADMINGQDGDEKIYHGFTKTTAPDGSQDMIICGEGKDEVWMNIKVDRDLVSNDCEIIHKG